MSAPAPAWAVLETYAREVDANDLPALFGRLEAVRALAQARLLAAASTALVAAERERERWLTPRQAAERFSVSPRWIDRHWRKLPFCHPLNGPAEMQRYRISERELEGWIRQQRG